jgi:hypothetical protein
MATAVAGAGFLILEDLAEDVSLSLFQPFVSVTVPAGGIAVGSQTVAVWDPSMYVGAQLVVGAVGGLDIEAVTITATTPGTSFTATFQNAHAAGEPIRGATFPVRQPTDPLFEQSEVIAYASTATNDFLSEVPLVYGIVENVVIPPSGQTAPLPSDCMVPARVAVSMSDGPYPLRETGQANLDAYDYRWSLQSQFYANPIGYFRDKIPVQYVGIWPSMPNTTNLEVVYAQRQAQTMSLADGFLFPDPFVQIVKWRTLSFCYSKDGEFKNPGLAKMWDARYAMGVKMARMILEMINDPSAEVGSQ